MRLIDADELKEQLSKETNIKSLGLWLSILQTIDNVPTVELKRVKNELKNELKKGCGDCKVKNNENKIL